jgi:hypothetical protein
LHHLLVGQVPLNVPSAGNPNEGVVTKKIGAMKEFMELVQLSVMVFGIYFIYRSTKRPKAIGVSNK